MTNRRCSCTVPLHYTSGWDQGTIEHEVKCKATEMGPRTMPWCLSGLTFIDSIHTEDSTLGRGSPDACGCATVRDVGVSLAPEKAAVGTHYRHKNSDSDAETQRIHERVCVCGCSLESSYRSKYLSRQMPIVSAEAPPVTSYSLVSIFSVAVTCLTNECYRI